MSRMVAADPQNGTMSLVKLTMRKRGVLMATSAARSSASPARRLRISRTMASASGKSEAFLGGLDGQHWIACRPAFFLSVRVLSRLFCRLS